MKEEQVLTERTHPWKDEALKISQAVDENLKYILQRETKMVCKALGYVMEELPEEARTEEKKVTEIL